MVSTIHSQESIAISTDISNNRDNEKFKANKQNSRLMLPFHYSRQFRSSLLIIPHSSQRYRSPHLEAEVCDTKIVFNNCRGYRVKVSLIILEGKGD